MKRVVFILGLMIFSNSCSPKRLFIPLDTIVLENYSDDNFEYIIKNKGIKNSFSLLNGIYYESNNLRYNMIHTSGKNKIKKNEVIFLIQVERNDSITTIEKIKNVFEDFCVIDNNGKIIIQLKDIFERDIHEAKFPENTTNFIMHSIRIQEYVKEIERMDANPEGKEETQK